jgi:hypothetical protein
MDRPYGISDFAFPSGNPAPTWRRGRVKVLGQTESRAKPDGERDRIPLGLAAVSIARLRFIVVETGNTLCAKLRFGRSPIWAGSAWFRKVISRALDTRATAPRWKATFAASPGRDSSYSTKVLTLTKDGHRPLERAQLVSSRQATYYGLVKPKEARHDADLYRLYQKVAKEIERSGGKVRRVILELRD